MTINQNSKEAKLKLIKKEMTKQDEEVKEKIIDKILKGDTRCSGEFDYDEMCQAIDKGIKIGKEQAVVCKVCNKHKATNFECDDCYFKGFEKNSENIEKAKQEGIAIGKEQAKCTGCNKIPTLCDDCCQEIVRNSNECVEEQSTKAEQERILKIIDAWYQYKIDYCLQENSAESITEAEDLEIERDSLKQKIQSSEGKEA